ncbi:MAG: hypothetical protein ACJAQZ_003164 [Planctomycetota bacterium]|jgi:hypothetical protein
MASDLPLKLLLITFADFVNRDQPHGPLTCLKRTDLP